MIIFCAFAFLLKNGDQFAETKVRAKRSLPQAKHQKLRAALEATFSASRWFFSFIERFRLCRAEAI
jgi:hypothetical protein